MDALNALALGLQDGGCQYVTNHPGFECHKLFSLLGGERISINERVAYEMAYGGSLAGKRSLVCFKSIGLNVCADSFLNSYLSGVNAGLVVVVSDDMQVVGSQTRQDSRHYLNFYGGLWFEPNSIQSAYDAGHEAFELSEKFDIPIVIRLTNQFFSKVGEISRKPVLFKDNGVVVPREKYIVSPVFWKTQLANLNQKLQQVESFIESYYADRWTAFGDPVVFSVGCTEEELLGSKYAGMPINNVTAYPLPQSIIGRAMKNRSSYVVFEQGDNVFRNQVALSLVDKNQCLKCYTGNVATVQWRIWNKLETFFEALKQISPSCVVSDVTQFTVESKEVVNSCLSLGSSVAVCIGMAQNGTDYPFAVVGDVSFLHGCLTSLEEAIARNTRMGIVIIDNGGSWCTGLQPGIVRIEDLSLRVKPLYHDYENLTVERIKELLVGMRNTEKLQILVLKVKNE